MSEPARSSDESNRAGSSALDVAREVARGLDERRAEDVVIIDVRAVLPITSYFVLATGSSTRAIRTFAEAAERLLRTHRWPRVGVERDEEGRWMCIDYSEVVVHIFVRDARQFYDLDQFWGDAPRVEFPRAVPADATEGESTGAGEMPRSAGTGEELDGEEESGNA